MSQSQSTKRQKVDLGAESSLVVMDSQTEEEAPPSGPEAAHGMWRNTETSSLQPRQKLSSQEARLTELDSK